MMTKTKTSNAISHTPPCINSQGGYTLIQMTIALLVIGILAAAFVQVYALYDQTQKLIKTQENVETAVTKIQAYRQAYGFYPCPAPMNVARDYNVSANEIYGATLKTPAIGAAPIGTCVSGVCIEKSTRTIAPAPATDIRVRVGAIPFRDMQMDEDLSFDGYGSKLWYAVTEDMCNVTTFNEIRGAINIQNENNEPLTNPPSSAAFIVVSPGPNKIGGYSKYGVLENACGGTGDTENCRDMSLAVQVDPEARYISSFEAEGAIATGAYDDIVQYFASAPNPLWRRETATSENIIDMTTANVGIGTDTPSAALSIPQTTVDSSTGVMALTNDTTTSPNYESGGLRSTGKVQTTKYCDSTSGTNCFQTKDITGDPDTGTGGMKCPAGSTYLAGISSNGTNAQPVCVPIGIFCPSGKVLSGFTTTAGGKSPVCSNPVVGCAAATDTLCGATPDMNIPALASGSSASVTTTFPGGCRVATYKCNSGTLTKISDNGATYCTNTSTTSAAIPCGTGWTGTYTTTDWTCAGPTTNNWDTACPPTCVSYDDTTTTTCPSPMTGGPVTTTTHYICSGGGTTHISDPMHPPTVTGTPCSCGLKSKNIFTQCPTGYERSSSAPPPPTSDTPSTNTWSAAPDITYGIVGTTTVDSGTCTSSGPGSTNNYCTCAGGTTYVGELEPSTSCQAPESGTRTFGGTAYTWDYNVYSMTIDIATCTPNVASKTLVSAAKFKDKSFKWRINSGALRYNQPSKGSYPEVADSCTCAQYNAGATSSCAQSNMSSLYDFYTCKCQE